jgi:hypothetical protein
MSEPENSLILEILKKLQTGQSEIKNILLDHGHQLVNLREEVINLRRDDLRHEVMQAQMDMRLDRIETRLELRDA